MPKIKTNRAAAKRFKRTASGRWKRRKSNRSHLLTKKSTRRKRHLRRPTLVSKGEQKRVDRMLPNA